MGTDNVVCVILVISVYSVENDVYEKDNID